MNSLLIAPVSEMLAVAPTSLCLRVIIKPGHRFPILALQSLFCTMVSHMRKNTKEKRHKTVAVGFLGKST